MQSASSVYVLPRAVWLWLLAMLGLAGFASWAGLDRALDAWLGSQEYSHALMIPVIAGYLAWQRREALMQAGSRGAWAGLAVVGFGAALNIAGRVATLFIVQQLALLVTFYGLILALLGWRGVRLLGMPLLLLLLMVPLPQFLLANLSLKLQLISSQLGVEVIRLFGISVFVEGNVIDLGGYKLQVAEACSGLRYLFPLMTLSLVVAYFFRAPNWQRAVILLSSVPVTVVMNGLRVGLIGVLVERWGVAMAEGTVHDFEGWSVFMACVAVLLLEVRLLAWTSGDRRPWREIFGLEAPVPQVPGRPRVPVPIPRPLLASAVLLAAAALAVELMPVRIETIPARIGFSGFPMQLGDWTGRRQAMDQQYSGALKLDDYLLADYARPGVNPVNLYIAWYNSQAAGEAVHSPRACLPGGGWQIAEFDRRGLPGAGPGGRVQPYNRVLSEYQGSRDLVWYWFKQRDRLLTDEYEVKLDLLIDAVRRHRSDGALVRFVVPLRSGQLPEDADRELVDFVGRVAPLLTPYVPD